MSRRSSPQNRHAAARPPPTLCGHHSSARLWPLGVPRGMSIKDDPGATIVPPRGGFGRKSESPAGERERHAGSGHRPQGLHRRGHGPGAAARRHRGRRDGHRLLPGVHVRGRRWPSVPEIERRHPRCDAGRPRGLRRRHPPRGAVERPARRPRPRADLRHQPPGDHPPRPARPRRRRRAVPLLVVVQQLRSRRRRPPGRDRALQPGHAVRRLQGARRAGPARAGDERLQPRATAQRHRLRRLAHGCAATSCSTT